jgi:hypothetical protein
MQLPEFQQMLDDRIDVITEQQLHRGGSRKAEPQFASNSLPPQVTTARTDAGTGSSTHTALTAACCSVKTDDLQATFSSLQHVAVLFGRTFNPKVAGSRPARPIKRERTRTVKSPKPTSAPKPCSCSRLRDAGQPSSRSDSRAASNRGPSSRCTSKSALQSHCPALTTTHNACGSGRHHGGETRGLKVAYLTAPAVVPAAMYF